MNEGSPPSPRRARRARRVPAADLPGHGRPLGDGEYYCLAKEYGYCDRRSGTRLTQRRLRGARLRARLADVLRAGELCYPKKLCPNDCSGAGACNHTVGACACAPGRTGAMLRAGRARTSTRSRGARTDDRCVRCEPGDSVGADSRCAPCWRFDARCVACDAGGCLACADPLLASARARATRVRAGRAADAPPPLDERERELATELRWRTQRADAFDEAEPFGLVRDRPPNATGAWGNPDPFASARARARRRRRRRRRQAWLTARAARACAQGLADDARRSRARASSAAPRAAPTRPTRARPSAARRRRGSDERRHAEGAGTRARCTGACA